MPSQADSTFKGSQSDIGYRHLKRVINAGWKKAEDCGSPEEASDSLEGGGIRESF